MTKNKRETTLIIIGAIVLVASIIILWFMKPKGVLVTENIEDYNTADYPVWESVFMETLPEKAEVVRYAYYDYWHEVRDRYLELKFETIEDLNSYLLELKEYTRVKTNPDSPFMQKNDLFIEETNPYNNLYTDLLCTYNSYTQNHIGKTGYKILFEDDETRFRCSFGIISYSYEELTIIQSVCSGLFRDIIHDYTPEYFKRFNVPTDKELERLFVLN